MVTERGYRQYAGRGMIAGNLDLFPDEAIAIIARKLGFGQAYERALTLALGRVP